MVKLLVRAPNWLGDAVVSTVFITRLKNRFRDAEISVLGPTALASIYETHPDVASVLPAYSGSGQTLFRLSKQIQEASFDAAYVLPRSFRTALEVKLAGIPKRIGFAGDGRRWLLTDAVPYDATLLYAHRYLKLIHEETLPLESVRPHFPKGKTPPAFTSLKSPLIGMAPMSVAPARAWDKDRFIEAAKQLTKDTSATVVLFGTAREKATTAFIQSALGEAAVDTAGQLSLPELGAVLSMCDVFIGNDSGLMHVASALRIPSVILFGASDPTYALPPWGRSIPLQHKEIACVPCLRNDCVRLGPYHKECLKAITVQEVVSAVQNLWEDRHVSNN